MGQYEIKEKCIVCESTIEHDAATEMDPGLGGEQIGESDKWICESCIQGLAIILDTYDAHEKIDRRIAKKMMASEQKSEKKVVESFNKLRNELKKEGIKIFEHQTTL